MNIRGLLIILIKKMIFNLRLRFLVKNKHINILIDTSGSVYPRLNYVLNRLKFTKKTRFNIIQCSHMVERVDVINSLKNVELHGNDGTLLMNGFGEIEKHYNEYNTILLTDGYSDDLHLKKIEGSVLILLIDSNTECKIRTNPQGSIKQIKNFKN